MSLLWMFIAAGQGSNAGEIEIPPSQGTTELTIDGEAITIDEEPIYV